MAGPMFGPSRSLCGQCPFLWALVLALIPVALAGPACLSEDVAPCSAKWIWVPTTEDTWGNPPGDSAEVQIEACESSSTTDSLGRTDDDHDHDVPVSGLTTSAPSPEGTLVPYDDGSTTFTITLTSLVDDPKVKTASASSTALAAVPIHAFFDSNPSDSEIDALPLLDFTPQEPWEDLISTTRVTQEDIKVILSLHNKARAKHGAVDLVWDEPLAKLGAQWASKCMFQHSRGRFGRITDNISASYQKSPAEAVQRWIAEARRYNPRSPVASHFTQVVWKATRKIGCGMRFCDKIAGLPSKGRMNLIVCEYSPPGNVHGQYKENVQP